MKTYLTPLAILVGAIIISVTTYVALTKPQQDMIKKKMDVCIESYLVYFQVKSLKELAKINATDDGVKGDVFVRRECEKEIYK
jgi:hypothetical protein